MPSVSERPTFRGDAPPAANFRDLLEVAPDAMVGVDRAGLIQFVNRHTESFFGYARCARWGVRHDSATSLPRGRVAGQRRPARRRGGASMTAPGPHKGTPLGGWPGGGDWGRAGRGAKY